MSQTNTIQMANESGAAFRGHLNEALVAITTNHSGAASPLETYPYMVWLDTSTNPPTPKRRNANDTGWDNISPALLTGADFTGNISAPAITAGIGAPTVKMKKIAGTSGTAAGSTVFVAHGLDQSKILAIHPLLENAGNKLMPSHFLAPIQYIAYTTSTSVAIELGASAGITSRPFTVLIVYEE